MKSTELQRQRFAEGDVDRGRAAALVADLVARAGMRHDGRGVGKDFAAVDMVGMVVAVDEIAHGLIESCAQLVFEPRRGVGIDRVGRDHARRCDRKNREMEIVAEAIDIACDLHDLAHRRLRLRQLRGLRLRHQRRCEGRRTGEPARTPEQIAPCYCFGCEDRIVVAAARALRFSDICVAARETGQAGHEASGGPRGAKKLVPSVQKSRRCSNIFA